MTTPSGQQGHEAGFFRAIRDWGLTRGDNGFLGGVVDGVAQRVGMATGPARIIVIAAAVVLNGLVPLAYAGAWALLPDRRGNIIVQNFGRGVPNVGALIGIAVLTLLGLDRLDPSVPFGPTGLSLSTSTPWAIVGVVGAILVPVVFAAGLAWFVVAMVRRSRNPLPTKPAAPDTDQGDTAKPVDAATVPRTASTAPVPPSPVQPMSSPPVPPAPAIAQRVPGPGRGFYLTALAWIVLSVAIAGTMERAGQLAVHPVVAWFVTMVTGLGILVMAISLAGRKLGFMGFMAITLALALPVIAAEADQLRDAYATNGSLVPADVASDATAGQAEAYDATADFARRYSEVVINGSCRQDATAPIATSSTARLSFMSLEADTTVDVVTEVTYVTIPEGTDLNVVGQGNAQAHVVWPERGISCDFWGAGGQHLTLANNVGPVVTLVVYDDAYANTIVITEVPS